MNTPLKEYSILLRAVSAQMTATGLLYEAARRLEEPSNPTNRAVNQVVCRMVAVLLGLPEAEPDLVERVLRQLP